MQAFRCTGPVASAHENHPVDMRLVVANEEELAIESGLDSLKNFNPLIRRIASPAVFNPDLFH
jgi:hypothetical protein